ncbi:MAG: thioredoxin family protein [Rhodobacteraceae bacterium]|jgi:thioredoxin 1|nr:thioredoxin family protein [Paracoccaceae bacterium]
MHRRQLLQMSALGLIGASLPRLALAKERVMYVPGLAEAAMDAGNVVFLDFWTNWCSTCATQERTISALRAADPAYDQAITFITVDWDAHADGDLARSLQIPRRSTLVALKGRSELGRIVAGTAKADIKALMDAALAAATA